MKIGIQAENLTGGKNATHAGIGRYTFMIIDHLLRIGDAHEWHLFTPPGFEPPDHWIAKPNFRHKFLGPKYRIWRAFKRLPYCVFNRISVWFVLSGPMMNHKLVRQAATVHDLFPFDYPEFFPEALSDLRIKFAQGQVTQSDLIFAVSENTKSRIVDRFKIDPEKIVVTPNGPGNIGELVPRASMTSARKRELGVPFDRYFFTLSTLEPRKNLDRLIQAMALLRQNPAYSDIGLAVGGGKGWKESSIFETVKQLGLEDAIAFLGYVPDENLPALFAGSEAAVCASIDEGFGIPILEAMLYGAPVVTSNRGALPEVGGDAVAYFDPMEPQAIADALASMVDGSRDLSAMTAQGFERAKLFTWEDSAQKTLKALERLGAIG